MELQEPSLQMLKERRKWLNHEADNIDAASRGGAVRSSDERSVMDLEPRGSGNQSTICHPETVGTSKVREDGGSLRDFWELDDERLSRPVLREARLKCLVYSPALYL